MLSHRETIRTSNFWQKSKERKRNFFRKFTKGIQGFDLGKKNSKLSHACVSLYLEQSAKKRPISTTIEVQIMMISID
jgi:hypothetical protein